MVLISMVHASGSQLLKSSNFPVLSFLAVLVTVIVAALVVTKSLSQECTPSFASSSRAFLVRDLGRCLLVIALVLTMKDLKDFAREAGDVLYTNVTGDGSGVVEFAKESSLEWAVKNLDGKKFRTHMVYAPERTDISSQHVSLVIFMNNFSLAFQSLLTNLFLFSR